MRVLLQITLVQSGKQWFVSSDGGIIPRLQLCFGREENAVKQNKIVIQVNFNVWALVVNLRVPKCLYTGIVVCT